MTELEFFAQYTFVPSVTSPDRILRVEKRGSGTYGELSLAGDEYGVRVIGADNVERTVGYRRTFAGAFKLLRERLVA